MTRLRASFLDMPTRRQIAMNSLASIAPLSSTSNASNCAFIWRSAFSSIRSSVLMTRSCAAWIFCDRLRCCSCSSERPVLRTCSPPLLCCHFDCRSAVVVPVMCSACDGLLPPLPFALPFRCVPFSWVGIARAARGRCCPATSTHTRKAAPGATLGFPAANRSALGVRSCAAGRGCCWRWRQGHVHFSQRRAGLLRAHT